jgi:hypothetical protein
MRHIRIGLLGLALTAPLAACDLDSLLEVPDPDVVAVPVFQDPENLPAVRAGAIRELARAYAGEQNNEGGQILFSGLLTDELYHSGTFTTRQEVDQRNIAETNSSNSQAFFWLQRARNHAEVGASLFAGSDQAGTEDHAELVALAGFSYIMFAENYCGGVPFSLLPIEGETMYGEPQSTEAILNLAIARFDEAMGMAEAGGDVHTMAMVGKARALLDLDRVSEAADLATDVPTGFEYVVAYSEAVRPAWNAVWNLVNAEKRWSASDVEGTNGLAFRSDDPRTPTEANGFGFDQSVDAYAQLKFDDAGDDVVLASGLEARLIEAEAALADGRRGDFFALHSGLRTAAGMDGLDDTGQSAQELVDLHFEERARWLWLTAHRLGDLRRLMRQYGRLEDEVFPIGATVRNNERGDMVTLRVPFTERENPSYDPLVCDPFEA